MKPAQVIIHFCLGHLSLTRFYLPSLPSSSSLLLLLLQWNEERFGTSIFFLILFFCSLCGWLSSKEWDRPSENKQTTFDDSKDVSVLIFASLRTHSWERNSSVLHERQWFRDSFFFSSFVYLRESPETDATTTRNEWEKMEKSELSSSFGFLFFIL